MIQKLLDKIKSQDVKNIEIKLEKDVIALELEDKSRVVFSDVASFLYTDDDAIDDPHMAPIVYEAGGVDAVILRVSEDEGGLSVPNFSVIHKDKSMLIEAGSLEVFGSRFTLNSASH